MDQGGDRARLGFGEETWKLMGLANRHGMKSIGSR
jgi:hypothetical protein